MVIWVGYGLVSKIAIAFLVAFFPIVVNTVVGLKEVEPELLELARINRGSQFDIFKKIRLPNSLPYMFAGIKVAIVLSVTGAIVAEFVAATLGELGSTSDRATPASKRHSCSSSQTHDAQWIPGIANVTRAICPSLKWMNRDATTGSSSAANRRGSRSPARFCDGPGGGSLA